MDEEKSQDPEDYVFVVDDEGWFICFEEEYWNDNRCVDDSGFVPDFLEEAGFGQLTESTYEDNGYNRSSDEIRTALIKLGCKEVPEIKSW